MGPDAPPWWNWYTRQVEGLCPVGRAGSSPVGGIGKGLACQNTFLAGFFVLGVRTVSTYNPDTTTAEPMRPGGGS